MQKLKTAYVEMGCMESEERKKQLRSSLKKQFKAIAVLPNHEIIRNKITDFLLANPTNNDDLRIFYNSYKSLKKSSDRDFYIISMACFLWKYESTYLLCIDALCYLLISTGHDLFNTMNREFVDSMDDINDVDISTKQRFLERHNFGLVCNKRYQRLRNKIAHHDYVFDENGRLHLGGEIINIADEYKEFLDFTCDIFTEIANALPTDN